VKRKIKREKKEIVEKKRRNEDIEEDDYNEIQNDFRLLKKLKKKKVKKRNLAQFFGLEIIKCSR